MSTGAILIADILPSFIIKLFSPFLPYYATLRIFTSCMLSMCSFIIVATASTKWQIFVGVGFTSFASGLGDPTFLALSTHYDKNVISTWSSGTGAAGVIGSISYSIMRKIGLSSSQTLFLMILVPIIEFIVYLKILSKPNTTYRLEERETEPLVNNNDNEQLNEIINTSMEENIRYVPKLMVYFIPLTCVYFFEYFVNQGLVRKNMIKCCMYIIYFIFYSLNLLRLKISF